MRLGPDRPPSGAAHRGEGEPAGSRGVPRQAVLRRAPAGAGTIVTTTSAGHRHRGSDHGERDRARPPSPLSRLTRRRRPARRACRRPGGGDAGRVHHRAPCKRRFAPPTLARRPRRGRPATRGHPARTGRAGRPRLRALRRRGRRPPTPAQHDARHDERRRRGVTASAMTDTTSAGTDVQDVRGSRPCPTCGARIVPHP